MENISCQCVILLGYWLLLAQTGFNDPWHNLPGRVDLALFGPEHIHVYNTRTGTGFDPEGLMGTLPSLVNMLLGYMTAKWLGQASMKRRAVLQLMGMAVGYLFCPGCGAGYFPIISVYGPVRLCCVLLVGLLCVGECYCILLMCGK